MTEKQLLEKIILRKEARLKNAVLESMVLAGFVGALVGMVLGRFYTYPLSGLTFQLINLTIYAAVGALLGFFEGKSIKEDRKAELLLLQDLYRRT